MGIRFEEAPAEEVRPPKGIQGMALGRSDLLRLDPRDLRIEPGFNARLVDFNPNDEEDLKLARSIAEVGVIQPLIVYMKDGRPTVTDGHRRLNATLYAMDVLGAPIKSVPVRTEPKHASETDRAYTVLLSGDTRHLAPIERANQYAKLIGFGETEAGIASKIGRSRQHVADMLALRAAPQVVVEMVRAGEVSATLATQTLKAEGGDGGAAADVLYAGLQRARDLGLTKATRKHIDRPAPDLRKSVGYAAAMKRAVEIAEGFLRSRDDDGEAGEIFVVRQIVDALNAEMGA